MPDGVVYRESLLDLVHEAMRHRCSDRTARAAATWIAFIAPEKARGFPVDAELLALNTVLVGFDAEYFGGLCRLFQRLGLSD